MTNKYSMYIQNLTSRQLSLADHITEN